MEEVAIPLLRSRVNPRTGKKRLSDADLAKAQPKWRREWEQISFLTPDMIDYCVYEIHTGPHMWPGNMIASGAQKGMNAKMYDVLLEWKEEKKPFTSGQLYREARKRLIYLTERYAELHDVSDPFGFAYFLTPAQRRKKAIQRREKEDER